jgi:uncharacterized protein
MIDDEKEPAEDGEGPKETYQLKKPRSLVAMLAIVAFVMVLALAGILTAVFSHSEDPSGIKIPVYSAKSLSDVQQVDTPTMHQHGDEVMDVLPPDSAPQSESPIDLKDSVLPPQPESEPEPEFFNKTDDVAPQSMIQWEEPKIAKVTPHNVEKTGHGKIAIVIDDMGLNRINTQRMVSMPAPLTLAYLPYADNLQKQADTARAAGHELMVHMPMEPTDMAHNNPGPNALLTTNTTEENVTRLQKNLAQFDGYMGVNNHMGSRFTGDPAALRPVLQTLKERGLWFLDSKTIGHSSAAKIAGEMGVPYAERDIFLDNAASVPAILAQLRQLEHVANKRGYAVAIGHPYTATIEALKQWIPSAEKRGFVLVPLSEIIASRFPDAVVPTYAQVRQENAIEPAAGVAAVSTVETQQLN